MLTNSLEGRTTAALDSATCGAYNPNLQDIYQDTLLLCIVR